MIIQCEQCRTKFKLDDHKVTKRGARVRCAKCRHIFTVHKPDTEPLAEETAPLAAVAPPAAPAIPAALPAFDAGPISFDTGDISFADIDDVDDTPPAIAPAIMPPPLPPSGSLDFGTVLPQAAEGGPSPAINFDFGEVGTAPAAPDQSISLDFTTKPSVVAAAPAGGIDFGGFDFDDVSVASPDDSFALENADFGGFAGTAPQTADTGDDLGFSFGDAAPQPTFAPAGDFDFSGMDFGTAQPAAATPAGDSFSLGEFNFGTEAASVAVPVAVAQPDGLFDFGTAEAPAATMAAAEQPAATDFTFEPALADEPSPLSIASRRRQSPVISALVVGACLLLVGALGFMGYLFLGGSTKAVPFFGKQAPAEDGKITVQQVQASFLTKAAAGDMLIITGEALNNFSKPRAALQVKATLFGANNEPVVTQLAYAGNPLTREQLASMPWDKIETAMNNQFGDSLANLGVAPGQTLPFTLVIVNPPATARDFSVEAVGSTIATSK